MPPMRALKSSSSYVFLLRDALRRDSSIRWFIFYADHSRSGLGFLSANLVLYSAVRL